MKGEGTPEVGEVWGVEMGVSLGSGKVKTLNNRATLLRRTTTHFGLKRASSKATLSEIVKKFGTFPFSMRQLDDERAAKIGVMECVRGNVLRQYEVVGDKEGEPVSRLFTTAGKHWEVTHTDCDCDANGNSSDHKERHDKASSTARYWHVQVQER